MNQSGGRSVRAASDTEAQLKPVKQDKSCLCQARALQSTAKMTTAQDSTYAAGISSKQMSNHIRETLGSHLQMPIGGKEHFQEPEKHRTFKPIITSKTADPHKFILQRKTLRCVIVSAEARRGLLCGDTPAVCDFGSGNGSKG